MIILLQRVSQASVSVAGEMVAQIGPGLLALTGFERGDSDPELQRLGERLLNYRVFADDQGKMNLSLLDVQGGLLLVPQFTLAADTQSGNRPGFSHAAPPAAGEQLFRQFSAQLRQTLPALECGVFGANMQVSLINDGPVTFWLQSRPGRDKLSGC